MALYDRDPLEELMRERERERHAAFLAQEYGPELGEALASSSLEVGAPVDENLAKALLSALTSGTPEQQVKALQALLAYARESGRAAAKAQSRRDNALY